LKEITIEITTYCMYECDYCSTKADRYGDHLDFKTIKKFIENKNADIINISGGEPLSHPEFYRILQLAKEYAGQVWVYTNAIENIRFNSDILKNGITCHANTIIREGEINIPPADKVHLLELQNHGRAENMKKVSYEVSGKDCEECDHEVLQADGKIARPCSKCY